MEMNEEQKQSVTAEDKSNGNKPLQNPLLEQANATAERLERAAQEARQEADRLEELKANQLLSGTAGARVEPAAPKVETSKEYAQRVLKNSLGTSDV